MPEKKSTDGLGDMELQKRDGSIYVRKLILKQVSKEEEALEVNLIAKNLKLILNNSEKILKNDKYFYCQLKLAFIGGTLTGVGLLPLGVLLLLWQKKEFIDTCGKCGGTVYLLGAAGSSLSDCHKHWGICSQCADFSRQHRALRLYPSNYYELLRKYENVEIIHRGKRKRFDWGKGIAGEDEPDTIMKHRVVGVTLTELIEYLNGNDSEEG